MTHLVASANEWDNTGMSQERSVRRRILRSAAEKQALLSAWETSGLSARAFAKQEGVRPSCLWRWKQAAGATSSKLPTVKKAPRPKAAITFAPVHLTKAQFEAATAPERVIAEVVLSREVHIRVLEGAAMDQVALLVHALAGGVAC